MIRPRTRRATRSTPTAVVATTIPTSLTTFYAGVTTELGARGFRVVTVAAGPLGRSRSPLHCDQHVVLPMRRDVSPLHDAAALARWVLLLARTRPDVVLAGTPKASLLAMLAGWATRTPVRVYHLLGLRLEGAQGRTAAVLATVERLTSACATQVIAVSPSLADEYRSRGLAGRHPVVVPGPGSTHGVDLDHFDPSAAVPADLSPLGGHPGRVTVSFVGRLNRDKGLDTLQSAMAELARRRTPCQLLVVGPVDDVTAAPAIEALRRLDVPVLVAGPQEDVRPWLAVSDLLVLPTLREGLPNVVLEAAAMGIPSITTRATGARDAVVDGMTGLLVDVGDGVGLAQAITALVEEPTARRRMGAAARARVATTYQPHVVAAAVVDALLN